MSNNLETTLSSSGAVTSSAKKASRKSTIVVRQTLTSKLRAERGDKLQFLKNQMQALSNQQSSSKESLSSVDKFKKPSSTFPSNNLKTPSQKPQMIGSNSASMNILKKSTSSIKSFNRATKPEIKTNKPNENNCQPIKKTAASNTSLNKNVTTVTTKTVSNCQSTKSILNKNTNKPILKTDQNKTNRFTSISNQTRSSLSSKFHGKFSLLPNQIKATLPKLDDKSNRRQTLMPQKKAPIVPKKEIPQVSNVIRKPALRKADSTSSAIKKTVTVKSPMRKSLTAMHFRRVSNCSRSSTIHRTVSWSDGLSPTKPTPTYPSPVQEQLTFRTPSMAKRRSVVFQTPMSIGKKSMSPFTVISTPTTSDLKRRLGLWLEKKGKPLDAFHHLRCFGINSTTEEIDEENKENFEVFIPEKDSSYEDLRINLEIESRVDDTIKNISIANDAMYDLHKLILEGYPRDQCEAWLDVICSKFQAVQEKPQYWECRAALEEARGNFQSALDCYSNAIAKGAEVEKVNEPLDNLLEKFSVLNINQAETSKPTKAVLDARNVFKSSIINFAIQERGKKEREQEDGCRFSATPVRRSTRRSRLHYVSRDDVKLCTTLDELDSPVRESLHFQTNRGFKH